MAKWWTIAVISTFLSPLAYAADKLVIISPHRKSIQQEYIPAFEEYYKKTYGKTVDVDWLDQGGTSDDIKFVKAKFASQKKGTGIDIFWGGGAAAFHELKRQDFLASFNPDAVQSGDVPKSAGGVEFYDDDKTWFASALSSFGVFYNRRALEIEKKPIPQTWDDLTNPVFFDDITLTDPRRSGSANTMNNIILKGMGWEKGWELLTLTAANTRIFTHSSTDPIKAVVSGDTVLAMAIDFFAQAKIADIGKENLGFTMPNGQTILDPDPIAILKGAANREVAERFVNFVLGAEAQKLLVLPTGQPDGPKFAALGRMSVNQKTYALTEGRRTSDVNPFTQRGFIALNSEETGREKQVFDDLIGAILVDTHAELKQAWRQVIAEGMPPTAIRDLSAVPVTEAEFKALVPRWNDNMFRNQTINSWVAFARQKYKRIAVGAAH